MNRKLFLFVVVGFLSGYLKAQGPPITSDKPIMLGAKRMVVKTLTEIASLEKGQFTRMPFMFHYLPSANSLFAIHIPLVIYNFDQETQNAKGSALGDLQLLAKYQFYRKDKTGKTFRMVAKTLQTFGTGKNLGLPTISSGEYQGYFAVIAGMESLKFGLSNELGYNFIPGNDFDELRYNLGFGLPIKPHQFPVNQINLYFEYSNRWYIHRDEFQLLYAQGIQFAKDKLTLEVAIQFPLIQEIIEENERKYSLYLGTRYIF